MELNKQAAQAFNGRANELPQRLTVRQLPSRSSAKQRFAPDVHVSATISAQNIRNLTITQRDREGREAGKAFPHEGATLELVGEAYQDLKKTAVGMQKSPDLRRSVSVELLIDLIFEWVKKRYLQVTAEPMTEYVLNECEKRIRNFEVWIPIASTHIQSELRFGQMTIKTITREMLDRWEAEFRNEHPEMPPGAEEFFVRWRKDVLGLAAATIELKAEPTRAYEVGLIEAQKTLDLLRCLSPQNVFPFVVSYSVPLGHDAPRSFYYLLTENNKVVISTRGIEQTPFDRWIIDDDYIAEMKKFGVDALSRLLTIEKRTAFQEQVLDALQLYGRSSTFKGSAEKLAYILTSLESLLLSNQSQSEEDLAERLALLVDKTLAGRKQAFETTMNIYKRRLSFIRGENAADDIKLLEQFMAAAWTFIINCIGYADKYETRDEFILAIDALKLSGGLK